MDRLMHTTAVRNLPLLLARFSLIPAGCRSTKSEVPPGRPYQTTGAASRRSGSAVMRIPAPPGGMAGLYGNKGPGSLAQDVQNSDGAVT